MPPSIATFPVTESNREGSKLAEVLAELDAQHPEDRPAGLSSSEQALLTTTDPDLFAQEFVERAALSWMQSGHIDIAYQAT